MDMDWLTTLLHLIPRFNLPDFQPQSAVALHPTWEAYMTTLLSWSVVVGAVALLGLVCIFIVWTLHCCMKSSTARGKSASRLSCGLFLLCLLCFITLGLALFGNERINRGVNRLTHGLGDVLDGMDTVTSKLDKVSETSTDLETKIVAIRDLIDGSAVNETDLEKLEGYLTKMENDRVEMERQSESVNVTVSRVSEAFHPVLLLVTRIEFERWICFASLFAIMIFVLFASSIGFCRHSKKASVIFSGLGLVVYFLGHALLALTLPLSLALADLCMDIRPVMDARMPHMNASQQLAMFYYECHGDESPPSVEGALMKWNVLAKEMRENVDDAGRLAKSMYPDNEEIAELMTSSSDLTLSLGTSEDIVASHLECSAFNSDYTRINYAVCSTAMGGVGLLLLALVLFNILIFILLLAVGRAWHLYSRRSLDYVEVDEQDPFMPRAAAVPIDIYGSHVYNQRSRLGQGDNGDGEASTLWSRENTRNDEVYDHYS